MLKQRFFVGSGPRTHELEGALMNYKQHGLSLVEYFGKLQNVGRIDKL